MATKTQDSAPASEVRPSIKPQFLSHGTLGSRDLAATRKFYQEFLNLEVVQTSPISLMVRLGGAHVYAVVQIKDKQEMPRVNHNGLDVPTDADVDEAHRSVLAHQETWGITRVTRPVEQHGTYSFMFWDLDDNCWEILSNPKGGYTWIFEQGDLQGRGHMDRSFRRTQKESSS
jgi:catechol 2,3-dioxygenase-like lactoylglutathione lyase family enzyme